MNEEKRGTFSNSLGFIIAAAGSAVGLGNIWRFPYLAQKNGGSLFLIVYVIFALTFGFTLLITEIAVGRKTKQGPLTAYQFISPKFKFLGLISFIVPALILPYYNVIGGWIIKYAFEFVIGRGASVAGDGYFQSFISGYMQPIIFCLIFSVSTFGIIYAGVKNGIEKLSKILMPLLVLLILILCCHIFFIRHTDETGIARTGLQGIAKYLKPDFTDMTFSRFCRMCIDAIGQLFFSLSVAMGIMISYGSYMKDDADLNKSTVTIEIFDTLIAFMAAFMIIPIVYVYSSTDGVQSGPGLMFIYLPKCFASNIAAYIIGTIFFVMVLFAAQTSAISICEAIICSEIDAFGWSRKKSTLVTFGVSLIASVCICFGYNILYFEMPLPNGSKAQLLDLFDYVSNSILMPLLACLICVMVGWFAKPKSIIEEIQRNGESFGRKGLYIATVKYVAPLLLLIIFLQGIGLF